MSATLIQNGMPGEDLIGIDPELLEQTDPGWLHRLALFSGRTLTAAALKSEQAYRAGRLAILGQSVTQGIVKGLELSADLTAADPILQVTPGYGISATGEDAALSRTLRTTLSALSVIDSATGQVTAFPLFKANPANTAFAGVILLQAITGQVSGSTFDTGSQPLIVSGNLNASCDQDQQEFAFSDWQIVDGVRLAMMAWPTKSVPLTLPPPNPPETWRNRVVYTIFNAEMALSPDDRLPWDLLGVPLGLVGFDTTWKPLFVDRAGVVRPGGVRRTRYVVPPLPAAGGASLLIQPGLAQARVSQLSEQIAGLPGLTNFVQAFTLLPPCGVLPATAVDLVHKDALWFPSNWSVTAGPVHQEEIETALLAGMTTQALDVTQNESVEILVPLPDELFDPNVLVTETVAQAFADAVNSATAELTDVLQHREAIQQESNALSTVITGTAPGPLYDLNAGLTKTEIALRDAKTYTPQSGETFGTVFALGAYVSTDYQQLLTDAANPPYTLKKDGNGNDLAQPLPLFSADDLNDLAQNGLQHFMDRITEKLSRANDILDLAFLTTQSDIYRYRQFILGAQGATALAVSPIAAQIATGESAAVTAANLQDYLKSILPPRPAAPTTTTTPPPGTTFKLNTVNLGPRQTLLAQLRPTTLLNVNPALRSITRVGAITPPITAAPPPGVRPVSTAFVPVSPGNVDQPASTGDVLSESPVVGAQLNLRTLTIAQRLANPPSQEGLFYATGNRIALLQLLADLEITIDDIPILVDVPPPPATTTTPAPTTTPQGAPPPPIPMPTIADIRPGAARRSLVFNAILTPAVSAPPGTDPDEADLFSTGIRVLDQHTTLMRAIEARIQQYNDFLAESRAKLADVQNLLTLAQALVTQLDNSLAQARQDVSFTTALLNDEKARVNNVNAKRTSTLQGVQVVVYSRPRSLESADDVPSRQLVPGNIANPVPSCLNQSVAIPPELREIVGLLREAPVSWLPMVQALILKLERPTLLQSLASDLRARATMQLSLPLQASSAASEPGVYAPVITNIFSANQQVFRTLQTQRAAFDPVQLVNESWLAQVQLLQTAAAVADLISSAAVHAEVVNITARLVQQISSVATCLYARAGQALPINRLAWAEFLRGAGVSIQLRSLAVLPNWNSLDYVSRQQMQMLVDWLFLQIDSSSLDAMAFMSDVVRVAILLASDAPVNSVIAGAVALATTPVVGGVIRLSLPSERIAAGMYVQLYSSGALAAQAVVSDFDAGGVRATVTHVYQEGVALQANDVAHFTAQVPEAPAIRAFDR
jgi:hypothetical protein